MKRLLFIILSLVLVLGLVACKQDTNETYSFKARIVQSNETTIIVEPLEGEEIRNSSDRISVAIGDIKELAPEALSLGTLVEIEYDGIVAETYPAQINVLSLKTIDE